ncbi:lipopolysaccharide biosynthesis protein [Elusimicrobiota bacterium]
MSKKAKLLVKSSVLRIALFFINAAVVFFLMPFIIHSLGDRMYGLWIFIGSVLGFYWIFDFGLASAVQRYVSRAIGSEDYNEANKIINTALFIFSLTGFIIILFTIAAAFIVPYFVKEIVEIALFRKIIILLGINFALGFTMRVFSGILTSHLRFDLRTHVSLFKLLIRTALVIFFLKRGYGILALTVITLCMDLFSYTVFFILAKRIAKYLTLSVKLIDKTKITDLLKYSIFTFIIQIADKLRFDIDNFVIATFVGLSSVTVYSIAARLIKYFLDFIVSVSGIMIPVFSQYESKGDYDSIRTKFVLTTKIIACLAMMIGGTLVIFGMVFIERWMGPNYLNAYPLLIILVVPITLDLMQSQSIQLLYGISKHKFFAISTAIEGVANLVLSIILVKKMGLMGVALGTAIPMFIVKLFIQPVYTCKVIKMSVYKYYFELIIPILLKSVVILMLFRWIILNLIQPNYLNISILILCEVFLFLTIQFFISFNKNERNYFRSIYKKKSTVNDGDQT